MTIVVASLSILTFLLTFHFLRVVDAGRKVIDVAGSSLQVMRDPSLTDDQKEKAVQKASLSLALSFAGILLRGGIALALSFAPIVVADKLAWVPADTTIAFLSRWDVILVVTVVITLAWVFGPRLWRSR